MPVGARKRHQILWNWSYNCELLFGCWESNPDSLGELSTAESFLLSPELIFANFFPSNSCGRCTPIVLFSASISLFYSHPSTSIPFPPLHGLLSREILTFLKIQFYFIFWIQDQLRVLRGKLIPFRSHVRKTIYSPIQTYWYSPRAPWYFIDSQFLYTLGH